jgi:hypothetical protein
MLYCGVLTQHLQEPITESAARIQEPITVSAQQDEIYT